MYVCAGQQLELLVLERAQVLRADLGRVLDLREVEALAQRALRAGCCRSRTSAGHCRAGFAGPSYGPAPQQLVEADAQSRAGRARRRGRATPRKLPQRGRPRAAGAPSVRSHRGAAPRGRAASASEPEQRRRRGDRRTARVEQLDARRVPRRVDDAAGIAASASSAEQDRPDARAFARGATASRTAGQRRRAGSSGRSRRRPRSGSARTGAPGRATAAEVEYVGQPVRERAREAEEQRRAEGAERPPVAEDQRGERDEAAPGGHVLVERSRRSRSRGTRRRAPRACPRATTAA